MPGIGGCQGGALRRIVSTALPLDGVRIVELADIVAGPSVGAYLGDFGAEIIKIERLEGGDAARRMGGMLDDRSAWWVMLGRNKRSVTLNLKSELGREAFLRLVDTADALVEAYRPGVLEQLGLSPEALLERNDRLVIVRISGFGQSGPRSSLPGLGTLAEAYSGFASITGEADGPPMLPPVALGDGTAGLFATWSLLAALYWRDANGGTGQVIDVSLFESLYSMLGPLPTLVKHLGHTPVRSGSRLSFSSPRNVYATSDGCWIALSGTAPSRAVRLLEAIGGAELAADPRFATAAERQANADDLDALVAGWVRRRTAVEVEREFERMGVAMSRIYSVAETLDDPHYVARGTLADVPDRELGRITMQAPVPRMSRTPGRIEQAGTALGCDTGRVLRGLGFSDAEVVSGARDGAWSVTS
jgi:crotonobetainyl-CoA:carnitine CoA-transferase CaiB-like acyl-CoA transferase